jgi:hypothetical protein
MADQAEDLNCTVPESISGNLLVDEYGANIIGRTPVFAPDLRL